MSKVKCRHCKEKIDKEILIEYKGYKDKLTQLDTNGYIANKNDKNELNFKIVS